jgi:hypothetical protein
VSSVILENEIYVFTKSAYWKVAPLSGSSAVRRRSTKTKNISANLMTNNIIPLIIVLLMSTKMKNDEYSF